MEVILDDNSESKSHYRKMERKALGLLLLVGAAGISAVGGAWLVAATTMAVAGSELLLGDTKNRKRKSCHGNRA